MFYSFNYIVKSRGVCNWLPTLCWDTRSPLGRLRDGVNATQYSGCRSILVADYRSHFSYLLPHYFYLLRVYIEPLELHSQSSRSFNPSHCKAYKTVKGLDAAQIWLLIDDNSLKEIIKEYKYMDFIGLCEQEYALFVINKFLRWQRRSRELP